MIDEAEALKNAGLVATADQLVQQLMSAHGQKDTLKTLARMSGIYSDAPPTWNQFSSDPHFMGSILSGLYPSWKEVLADIYPNPFFCDVREVVLGGGIGIGKTTAALAGISYDMCRLMYMKNPHERYKLIKTTKITLGIVNATLALAGGVNYDQLISWFNESPFFRAQMKASGGMTLFPNNIGISVGSRSGAFLGQAVVMALIDEANFMDKVHNQAIDVYNAIKARMESRFKTNGRSYPGRIWICSSKTDKGAFVEEYIVKHIQDDPLAKIFEFANWEVLERAGKLELCGKTFPVFIGDDTKDPFIIQGTGQSYGLDESRVIQVPTEFRQSFDMDLYRSLQDLAGKSTQATYKFITSVERLNESFKFPNPVTQDVIRLDFFDEKDALINYLDYPKIKVDSRPRFVHIDLGISNDKTGLAAVRLDGVVTTERHDPISGKMSRVSVPKFTTDFVMAIESRPGQEVPIFKIKNFLIDLRSRGYVVAKVSTDGYQSTNLRQDLLYNGFEVALQSVDRTMDPYVELKTSILESRVAIPNHPILITELKNLQRVGSKVDHPVSGCFVGSALISTPEGPRRLDSIDNGDLVYGVVRDKIVAVETTGARVTKVVNKLTKITLSNELTELCTDDHPWLTTEGYVEAKDLTTDHTLVSFIDLKVVSVEEVDTEFDVEVFDIEVPDTNNFLLSSGAVVHNSKDLADALCGAVWGAKLSMATMMSNVTVEDYMKALESEAAQNPYMSILSGSSPVKVIR